MQVCRLLRSGRDVLHHALDPSLFRLSSLMMALPLPSSSSALVRVRPPQEGAASVVGFPLEGLISVAPLDGRRAQEFEFDHVFAPEASQEAVYAEVSSLVRSCADGYNVCIFAYGWVRILLSCPCTNFGFNLLSQDDGKRQDVHDGGAAERSRWGPARLPSSISSLGIMTPTFRCCAFLTFSAAPPGINVRALQDLFSIASEEGGSSWHVGVSMMEIYNEAVHDLLRPASEVVKPLEVSGLGVGELPAGLDRVSGLTWRSVSNTGQVCGA